jgi:hypothetical protein
MIINNTFKDIIAINSKKLENVLPKFNGENKQMNGIEIDLIYPFAQVSIGKLCISELNINFDINNYIDNVNIVAFYEKNNELFGLDIDSINYLESYLTKHYSA